jgi:hypothetical protein
MNETDWLASTNPQAMLAFLRTSGKASDRKLRLFVCACARSVWPWLVQDSSRKAVEVAERYADGLASLEEMAQAWREATPDPSIPAQRWSQKQVAANEIAVAVSSSRRLR